MIKLILLFIVWAASAIGLCAWLCPEMLLSGQPELVLLAFLMPPIWMLIGVLAWIALADLSWREEYDGLASPVEPELDTPSYQAMIVTT